jgi:hypothetical protein
MISPFHRSNYKTLNSKNNKDSNLFNSQTLSNKDYSNYDKTFNINMKNYFSLNNEEKAFVKSKQKQKSKKKILSSRTNLNLNANSYKIKKIISDFTDKQKTKTIERNNTPNFKNINNSFSMNKRKMGKNFSSMDITRSKIFKYYGSFTNNNNHHYKNKSQVMNKNYRRPSAIRKNTDIFYLGRLKCKNSFNVYDTKLRDENKK